VNCRRTTYNEHRDIRRSLSLYLNRVSRCFTRHHRIAQRERSAIANDSRKLHVLLFLQNLHKLRDLHILYPVTRELTAVLSLTSTPHAYPVRALPACFERTPRCWIVLPGQILTNGELGLNCSCVVNERDVKTNVDLFTDRLRDVCVHEADANGFAVSSQQISHSWTRTAPTQGVDLRQADLDVVVAAGANDPGTRIQNHRRYQALRFRVACALISQL
jgi:hypothetical protein